jgi:hypothetical protein
MHVRGDGSDSTLTLSGLKSAPTPSYRRVVRAGTGRYTRTEDVQSATSLLLAGPDTTTSPWHCR